MRDLNFRAPLALAIAENASSPAGLTGSQIWSTVALKLLTWDGSNWIAPATGGGSGSGDVVGPSSATSNGIVTFNGTTGKLVKSPANATLNTTSTNTDILISRPGDSSGGAYGGIRSVRIGADVTDSSGEFTVIEMKGTTTNGSNIDTSFTKSVYPDGVQDETIVTDSVLNTQKTISHNIANYDSQIQTSDSGTNLVSFLDERTNSSQSFRGNSLSNSSTGATTKIDNYCNEQDTFLAVQANSNGSNSEDSSQITVVSGFGTTPTKAGIILERWDATEAYTAGRIKLVDNSGIDLQVETDTTNWTFGLRKNGEISLSGDVGDAGMFLKSNGTGNYAEWDTISQNTVGLGNVDNTSDLNKPISTATQTALDGKEASITKSTGYAKWTGSAWSFVNETYVQTSAIGSTVQAYSANLSSWSSLATSAKQDTLVSGTSIKTINGASVLGSGNVAVGDVVGPASAIDTQVAVFDGTTGKLLKTVPLYAAQVSSTIATISSIDAIVLSASTKSFAILANGELQVNGSPGTAGQVLTSGGSGAQATWQTPSGGSNQITVSATAPSSPTTNQLWLDIS